MPTWDLLLPTLPHRHDQLCALLAEINRQWQPGLGMLICRDNLQRGGNASYGKWQDLQEWSEADYTSFIGDDDWIAPDFAARINRARDRPRCRDTNYNAIRCWRIIPDDSISRTNRIASQRRQPRKSTASAR